MAEKKDVAMNTFPQVTNAEYVYAEDANLNQVKINKSDLAIVLAEYLPTNSVAINVNVERLYVLNIPTKKNGTAIGEVFILSTNGTLESRKFTYVSTNYNVVVSFESGVPKGTKLFVFYSIVVS